MVDGNDLSLEGAMSPKGIMNEKSCDAEKSHYWPGH